jgi:hypothetical protein
MSHWLVARLRGRCNVRVGGRSALRCPAKAISIALPKMPQANPITDEYAYPVRVRRIVNALWLTLLIANLIEYVLEWARVIYTLLLVPLNLPFVAFLDHSQPILPTLLAAHIGLFVALIVARALAFSSSSIALFGHGIFFETRLGNRLIRYDSITSIYSTSFQSPERFVVWVESSHVLPLQNWVASLLFGRWFWGGFLFTSDLVGFDQVMAIIIARMKKQYGIAGFETRFHEVKPTTLFNMLVNPRQELHDAITQVPLTILPRDAVLHSVSVSMSLALPLVVAALIHAQIPFGALVVPFLALAEFALAPLYLSTAPIETVRQMEFAEAWRIYSLTQLPRWLAAFALTWMVIAGVPLLLFVLAIAPALVLGCYWVIQLAKEWFEVELTGALIATVLSAVWQIVVYLIFVAMLPR